MIKHYTNTNGNAIAFTQLCLLLNSGAYTQAQIADATGLTPGTVCRWLKLLRTKELVYVTKWIRPGKAGHYAAVWSWGYRTVSAPKPKPLTQAQYNQNSRIRKQVKQNVKQVEIRRAHHRSHESGSNTISPISDAPSDEGASDGRLQEDWSSNAPETSGFASHSQVHGADPTI